MYFKSTVKGVTGINRTVVAGEKFTPKDLQTLTRLVMNKLLHRHIMTPLSEVSVATVDKKGFEGFHYSYRISHRNQRAARIEATILIQISPRIKFPIYYYRQNLTSLKEVIVFSLGCALMYHHQYTLGKKLKRTRIYDRAKAKEVAAQALQHYRVYAVDFDLLASKLEMEEVLN